MKRTTALLAGTSALVTLATLELARSEQVHAGNWRRLSALYCHPVAKAPNEDYAPYSMVQIDGTVKHGAEEPLVEFFWDEHDGWQSNTTYSWGSPHMVCPVPNDTWFPTTSIGLLKVHLDDRGTAGSSKPSHVKACRSFYTASGGHWHACGAAVSNPDLEAFVKPSLSEWDTVAGMPYVYLYVPHPDTVVRGLYVEE
jgi:hypothetical protein